ncbi:GNAT family N-acetyltransferase [Burkholderia contaminans]|uniref:GNAT family N-acetyltransferase n=1 Tax=Burkholderia contaminans TaxID=488447 RepID=UPI00214F8FF8|nr:GNAT family protein [Burkholderia contaminans]UUX38885.1 GNAT family N-acetyltransferase [Burkholderia contaminans]
MRSIIWDQPERVMRFVAERTGEEAYRDYTAIGLERDGHLVAGVVYALHTGRGGSVLMHVASDGSRQWMTPSYLAACFRYPFLQLECRRVTGLVRADNMDAQRFDEHLGFRREGLIRQGCTDGTDMILYGMLASECRFLEGKHHAALLRAA